CAEGTGSAGRLAEVLAEEGLSVPVVGAGADLDRPGVRIVVAGLDRGFVVPGAKVAVLAEADLTGRRRPHRVARARARATDGFFDDLAPGDYVVHRQHGVARYAGMVTRTVNGAARDYLLLEYRGDDKLYLPSDQIEALTPYSGGEAPTLSRLGGSEWARTRAKARAAVHQVARELVELYRARMQIEGHAFPPDTPWQAELEQGFGFVETLDQLRAVEEVKADMETAVPMDRLVCGDVGFGKTEVAVRAAFKAVQDGTQVAVLVPTTLLAQQHSQTFAERYAGYPVRVEMLSRFLTPAQARQVVQGLADGTVDVVVGTHRLLAGDVAFKRLGLLVVDEEQRFGVSHKEAIKALSTGVDVLTLTASPIPRTLEMALTGIREMSLINTPPAERQPILTYVGEYDEAAVVEALRRELLREGQVFFVHNWVQDIDAVATRLRRLVPEARVAVAHGQMDEGSLEKVVLDFWEKHYDVLVCTTIIESGIDMPTVNTLVVDRADRLGLGQLHQLRGRVGRSGHRAYAYLLHPADRVLSEAAYERLRTIGEHTELGSGFKIAMRDLEIRGAGNLLGRDQSGHIAAVGYDLYVQLVAEAVAELKGEPLRQPVTVTIDIPSDAHLPADYVAREDLLLEAYRRLAAVVGDEEVADIRAEWEDRFGPVPSPAEALLAVAALRVQCLRTGVREVTATAARPSAVAGRKRQVLARLSPLELPASARVRLRRLHPEALYKEEPKQLQVPLDPEDVAGSLVALLEALVPPPAPDEPTSEGRGRADRVAAS
ncbi:MAG: transcription-repair coupling factor, partial [Acidobacteriota bacterium]|nr:transcription-repair coupling factor [Acidobacteriota bacterium]